MRDSCTLGVVVRNCQMTNLHLDGADGGAIHLTVDAFHCFDNIFVDCTTQD
jgi:hypothetical protein